MVEAPGGAALLYISYDGMTDPLGQSQVLPYLTGLADRGHRITLLSLEKPALFTRHRRAVEEICRTAGIAWHPLPYRDRPPILSAWANVRRLGRAAQALHRRKPFAFTHCRSDLAGMVGLAMKRRHRLPFLYDMRAFWPDERAEGGAWDLRNPVYRLLFRYFKRRQRELVANADEIVTLSEAGRDAIPEMTGVTPLGPVTVIPCCADFSHFRLPDPAVRTARRAELGIAQDELLLIHLGSLGCNAMVEEMVDFLAVARAHRPGTKLLFVAPEPKEAILPLATRRGLSAAVLHRSATRDEVPQWLAAADAGIFFVRPVPSKRGASPTKMGELLASGLPIFGNRGVGDVAAIVTATGAGVLVDGFAPASYERAMAELGTLEMEATTIRERARGQFDLGTGIERYDAIYRRLALASTTEPKEPALA